MTFYCFHQTEDRTPWVPSLATERQNVIRDVKPKLITVLDVDNSFQDEDNKPGKDELRYQGPMYFDLDGDEDEREEVINAAKDLANVFIAKGANPNMFRIFLSGKKGLHFEIPASIFIAKVPPQGIKYLPAIYKEVAFGFKIPFIDMRVYTGGRGRQWRCENVERDNHRYKVPITAAELFELTPEKYDTLCSAPRMAPPVEPPAYNANIALLYSMATEKVEKARDKVKKRKATETPIATKLNEKFKGEWPEIVTNVLNGAIVDPDAGWNRISLQVAITAAALGKTEAELLDATQGLLESHKSDSHRYNTPRKRRRDLIEMFGYVKDNDAFEFSVGGFLSIVLPDCRANHDLIFGDFEPTEAPVVVDAVTGETKPENTGEENEHTSVRFNKRGIYVRNEDVFVTACDLGLAKPISIKKMNGRDIEQVGYMVEVYNLGKIQGISKLPTNALLSKSAFNSWAMDRGSFSMKSSDVHVQILADLLRKKAETMGNVFYSVDREGIDVVVPPGDRGKTDRDVIWAMSDRVLSNCETKYVLNPVHSDKGAANSDLYRADDLEPEDAAFFADVLEVSTPQVLVKMMGYFSVSFFCQHIRSTTRQFPLLQVYGQAGAGKSTLVELFNRMHYGHSDPRQMNSLGQTLFPILVAIATSASVPVVFEEMKPREMPKLNRDVFRNIFKSAYRGDSINRGSLGKDKAVREPTVVDYHIASPIVFVGEGLESQAAILERCVVVSMSEADRIGRDDYLARIMEEPTKMGRIGKELALTALVTKPSDVKAIIDRYLAEIKRRLPEALKTAPPRSLFNVAVALTGIELLANAIRSKFGTQFDEKMLGLRDVLLDNLEENIPKNMPEAARVLDAMAMLSRHRDPQFQLIEGQDYTLDSRNNTVDIKLIPAYHKYVRYQRALQLEVLYDNEDAFIAGMSTYPGMVKRSCPDNRLLFDSARAKVFRFNLDYLAEQGVDSFGVI